METDEKNDPKAESTTPIGIDLGTSFSCVAAWINNRVEIIPNDMGERTTPSYVSFSQHEKLIGSAALNQAARNPTNTIFDARRLIGRNYNDDAIQSDIAFWPFSLKSLANGRPVIEVTFKNEKKSLYAEEIMCLLIKYLKKMAENYIGKPVHNAIITVPAMYNDLQRRVSHCEWSLFCLFSFRFSFVYPCTKKLA